MADRDVGGIVGEGIVQDAESRTVVDNLDAVSEAPVVDQDGDAEDVASTD